MTNTIDNRVVVFERVRNGGAQDLGGLIGRDWCDFILVAVVTAINLDVAEYKRQVQI